LQSIIIGTAAGMQTVRGRQPGGHRSSGSRPRHPMTALPCNTVSEIRTITEVVRMPIVPPGRYERSDQVSGAGKGRMYSLAEDQSAG
jgi:hypothetical protein